MYGPMVPVTTTLHAARSWGNICRQPKTRDRQNGAGNYKHSENSQCP